MVLYGGNTSETCMSHHTYNSMLKASHYNIPYEEELIMKKRHLKKQLNKKLRAMPDQELIHLHMNFTDSKEWPLVDKEIRNRFDYEVRDVTVKFVEKAVDAAEGDMVSL